MGFLLVERSLAREPKQVFGGKGKSVPLHSARRALTFFHPSIPFGGALGAVVVVARDFLPGLNIPARHQGHDEAETRVVFHLGEAGVGL